MRSCDGPFVPEPEMGVGVEGLTAFSTIAKMVADLVSPYV
jgi:hypothetical protein